jgi:hypothetical protein
MKLISEKTWKLFLPIFLVICIMFLGYYSRDLLKYGNQEKYPIYSIVEGLQVTIIIICIIIILFMIELYLTNILHEIKIRDLERELERVRKR